MTTVGFELEVSRGALETAAILHRDGRIANARHHQYHCRCDSCDFTNRGDDGRILFSMQADCTANGEFITKVLEYGPEVNEAADTISAALIAAGAVTQGNVGLHVHVNRPGDEPTDARVIRMFLRYQNELEEIAAGARPEVRSYNDPMEESDSVDILWDNDPDDFPVTVEREDYLGRPRERSWSALSLAYGSWLSWDRRTYEFRLWNATLAAWRVKLAVGLSHAIVHAAMDGLTVERNDPRPLEEVLAPWLTDEVFAFLLVQRHYKGGVEQ